MGGQQTESFALYAWDPISHLTIDPPQGSSKGGIYGSKESQEESQKEKVTYHC
jgi:hypothetical protein